MRFKLSTKYVGLSCTTFLIIMVCFALLHVLALKKSFTEESIYEADSLSEMLLRNTYYQMLYDDRETLQRIIAEAGRMERIKKVRLFGKEGIVKFSTDPAEIETALSDKDERCVFCHVGAADVLVDAPVERRSRIYTGENGDQLLSMTRGIYNEPNCFTSACHFHTEEENKLGILEVVVSLEKMNEQVAFYQSDIFTLTFIILILLSVVQYLFTRKLVGIPINNLLHHTKCLASGDLSARIESDSGDEIGELNHEFNQMASNLSDAQQELQTLASSLEVKVEERTAEIKEMQSQLVQSAKLVSMGQLVAGIAHEINNPLGGILMFSSLVAKSKALNAQEKENVEVIIAETKRCAKIVRGLLDFSRESIPEKRLVSILEVLEHSLNLVSQQSLFQDIEVQVDFCPDLPQIYADPDQLQQVFFNLFINAAQAMPAGGALKIHTAVSAEKKAILIDVIDTGQGIPQEIQDKIFDPFFSTKAKQGFGLGLSISYGIISNHDGEITVHSEPGKGTRFTIWLPANQTANELAADNSGIAPDGLSAPGGVA